MVLWEGGRRHLHSSQTSCLWLCSALLELKAPNRIKTCAPSSGGPEVRQGHMERLLQLGCPGDPEVQGALCWREPGPRVLSTAPLLSWSPRLFLFHFHCGHLLEVPWV